MIIGIDGATFKVIDYLTHRGRLSNLKKMMEEGIKASLISTIQPLSHTAWVSLYTGKNPGKHGICDAVRRRKDSYGLQPINANLVRHEPLWSVLSRHGKRVCVYNVPITYPPRPVNGIMISGMDTPSIENTFTHPESLREELLREFPHYTIDLPLDAFISARHPRPLRYQIDKIYETLETQIKIIDYLASKEDWDLFFGIITVTDRLQHLLWRYLEQKLGEGKATADDEYYAEGVFGAYDRIDEALGSFLQRYGSDRRVMIVSDHGFGPLVKDVHLNNFLAEHGFLSYCPRSFWEDAKVYFRSAAQRNLPVTVKKYIKRTLPRGQPFFERLAQQIDWKRTRVYSLGYFGNLYVNLKGREPMGIVERGNGYESLIEDLKSELYGLRDPEDGRAVVDQAYRKEELYHGEALDVVPDIFLVMRDYAYMALNQFKEMRPSAGIFGEPLKGMGELSHTGSHRREGILIFSGENVLRGKHGEASILDIAPTVLYASGLPILKDYDGKVLFDFFEPSWRAKRKIDYELHEYRWGEEAYYSEREEQEVKERLQGLGYL
jgi:predicted AlkP superfamily phosphohydrolase/phosphomutase